MVGTRHEALRSFYESRYSVERGEEADVRPAKYPDNRFSQAVTVIPGLLPSGARVLEIGAGTGSVSAQLLSLRSDIRQLIVTEYTQSRVRRLRDRLSDPRVVVAEMDAEDPDPGIGRFDAVIMIALIEHLVDPLGAMQQIRQWIEPGGFVFIETPNFARYVQRSQALLGRFPSTSSKDEGLTTYGGEPVALHDDGHLHYFTFRSLEKMLTSRCGFDEVRRLPYAVGHKFSPPMEDWLAHRWPTMFSDLCLAAYTQPCAQGSRSGGVEA